MIARDVFPRYQCGQPRLSDQASLPLWRLTVEQYHEMVRHDILGKEDRVELLEGILVSRFKKTPLHTCSTGMLREEIRKLIPDGWFACSSGALTTDDSEPDPDLLVVRGTLRDIYEHHPCPEQVGLVAEVADKSLDIDLGIKKRIYGRARIATYWLINLSESRVEVFSDPTGPTADPGFNHVELFEKNDRVPLVLDGISIGKIPVAELIP